jgi:steroid 5-alpha reductase family enzyme
LAKALVLACAIFYFLRLCFGAFYLVTRKLGWGETLGVGLYIVLIHVIFASFRATNSDQPAYLTLAGSALYIFGSYLNTGAELARHLWKHNPENAGHLYTGGLFRYSRHINYFGDELLFSGYALISGSRWALLIPALMAVGFIFFNIPMLDRYLHTKYGHSFDAYALHTKKFIPFLY